MKWTDRYGNSHQLDELGDSQCNLKAPTMFTDEGKISDKNLLPIQSWSYGPLRFENEKITITIGSLQCDPKTSDREEKSIKMRVLEHANSIDKINQKSQENLNTLKTLMNTKESNIRLDMVNLHDKSKGKIDDLKVNMKSFVIEKFND